MTTVIKSNAALTVAGLGSLRDVTQTPAEIYADYAARVVADGGAVQSPSRTLAAIEAAVAGGYFSLAEIAISPQWGTKKSGSNILKFYGLNGKDGTCFGTIVEDVSTKAYATAQFNSGADYVQFSDVTLGRYGQAGCILAGAGDPGNGANGAVLRITDPVSSVEYYYSRYQGRFAQGGVIKLASNPDFAVVTDDVSVHHVNLRENFLAMGINGEYRKGTSDFIPYEETAGAVKLDAFGTELLAEAWYLSGATLDNVQAAGVTLGDRY